MVFPRSIGHEKTTLSDELHSVSFGNAGVLSAAKMTAIGRCGVRLILCSLTLQGKGGPLAGRPVEAEGRNGFD